MQTLLASSKRSRVLVALIRTESVMATPPAAGTDDPTAASG